MVNSTLSLDLKTLRCILSTRRRWITGFAVKGMRRKKKVVRSRCDNNRRFLQDDVLRYGDQLHFPQLAVGWNPSPAATVGFVFIGFGAPIQPKMLLSMDAAILDGTDRRIHE